MTAGHRADAVIENIRAHFKKDARTRAPVDIDDVIQEALTVVRDKLQTHRVAVRADPNERLPRIRGDQVQLQLVLVNLITNAIDSMAATDWERVLSIRSEVHHAGCVMVSVEDTGKGLEPGAVDRIFNPMFTTKAHGMGMGLSICRSIIDAHEGQFWVIANKRARCHLLLYGALRSGQRILIGPTYPRHVGRECPAGLCAPPESGADEVRVPPGGGRNRRLPRSLVKRLIAGKWFHCGQICFAARLVLFCVPRPKSRRREQVLDSLPESPSALGIN